MHAGLHETYKLFKIDKTYYRCTQAYSLSVTVTAVYILVSFNAVWDKRLSKFFCSQHYQFIVSSVAQFARYSSVAFCRQQVV